MKAMLKFRLWFTLLIPLGAANTPACLVQTRIKIEEEMHRAARRHLPRRKVFAHNIEHICGDDTTNLSKDSIYYTWKKFMYVVFNIGLLIK